MSDQQPGEGVPAAQRGSWTSFLKSIAAMSGDLSTISAPPFILSPVSLTEYPAYWCEHPDLFAAIADAPTPEKRALAVLKWFISTLKGQYTSRNETAGSEKKPLNPVLGELFYGQWPDVDGLGETNLLVEQVSHHPPITAYVIENKHKGLRLVGYNAQRTVFNGTSITVKQVGHAVLNVDIARGEPEEYLITFPKLRIEGLWYGSPYIELTETSHIVGSTGWAAVIKYEGRGYFSGKAHSFTATLSPPPSSRGDPHIIEGTWDGTSHLKPKNKGLHGDVKGLVFYHVPGMDQGGEQKTLVDARGGEPDGAMGEFETRRLWAIVAKGIMTGDFELASREKVKIENEQRQRRKDEAAAGKTWSLKHFAFLADDPTYESLAKTYKAQPPTEEAYVFLNNWPASLSGGNAAAH